MNASVHVDFVSGSTTQQYDIFVALRPDVVLQLRVALAEALAAALRELPAGAVCEETKVTASARLFALAGDPAYAARIAAARIVPPLLTATSGSTHVRSPAFASAWGLSACSSKTVFRPEPLPDILAASGSPRIPCLREFAVIKRKMMTCANIICRMLCRLPQEAFADLKAQLMLANTCEEPEDQLESDIAPAHYETSFLVLGACVIHPLHDPLSRNTQVSFVLRLAGSVLPSRLCLISFGHRANYAGMPRAGTSVPATADRPCSTHARQQQPGGIDAVRSGSGSGVLFPQRLHAPAGPPAAAWLV